MSGKNNNVFKMSNEAKLISRKRQSDTMKQLILDGKFTPTVTNSWCKSRIKVNISRNSEDIIISCRSSWDAYFQIHNPTFLYENVRIPYEYCGKFKVYLVDFVDTSNRKLYEIKPSGLIESKMNRLKEHAAISWAKSNNYTFEFITQKWFKKYFDISKIKTQSEYTKIKRLLSQFHEN